MAKLPFMKFYPSDFVVDTQTLSIKEIGAWVRLMNYIWLHSENGTVKLSNQEIAHLWGIELNEAMEIFCLLWDKGICDVERTLPTRDFEQDDQNKIINKITSRRIERDKKELKQNALYVKRSKGVSKGIGKVKVRDKKSEVRSQNITPIVPKPSACDVQFEQFWKAYPRKVGKGAARKAWDKIAGATPMDSILTAIDQQTRSDQWKKDAGQFIPHPATWINQQRWLDEPYKASKLIENNYKAQESQETQDWNRRYRAEMTKLRKSRDTRAAEIKPGEQPPWDAPFELPKLKTGDDIKNTQIT